MLGDLHVNSPVIYFLNVFLPHCQWVVKCSVWMVFIILDSLGRMLSCPMNTPPCCIAPVCALLPPNKN